MKKLKSTVNNDNSSYMVFEKAVHRLIASHERMGLCPERASFERMCQYHNQSEEQLYRARNSYGKITPNCDTSIRYATDRHK